MILSLIGMSGSGKTRWSKKLAKRGFDHLCCDDLIEEKLSPELKKLGYRGIEDVAKWLGYPYEQRYSENAAKYLHYEKEVMQNILNNLDLSLDQDIVIDTTGSVVHTGEAICSKLKKLTKVLYLETPQEVQEEMFKQYLKKPKPVIWGKFFEMKKGEGKMQALARCYPRLLKKRTELYERYADLKLEYQVRRAASFTTDDFLRQIRTI